MRNLIHTSFIASLLAVFGCGSSATTNPEPSGPSVSVSYQSGPLADVEVSLHATSTGPSIAKAVSASDGRANFPDVPSPEPAEYFVSLQSLGDGGWILDQKFAGADNGLRIKPLADNQQQKIKLPRGAVRPLTSN